MVVVCGSCACIVSALVCATLCICACVLRAHVRMCVCVRVYSLMPSISRTLPSSSFPCPPPPSPRSSTLKWLKLASAYAESPLRVGCLEWPLRISPQHALQLQMSAALRSTMPVKSRHSQVCLLWCVTKSCDLSPLSSLPPFFFVHEYFCPWCMVVSTISSTSYLLSLPLFCLFGCRCVSGQITAMSS